MPLLSFWKSNRDQVLALSIEQVVANAGDGYLRDQCETSDEFRQFLRVVPSERLYAYGRHCLEIKVDKGGFVLQDIVNELGRRLDFDIESGLYQGRRNAIGFDGIWRSNGQPDLIIETKTTADFTVSLDDLAGYKGRLISEGRVQRDASTLIVVGREDTGALEAQVRGSRYAWEMRLISVERLIKLVQIKEKSDDPATIYQIRQLLQPFEYTKIDKIIDVIFTTAVDVENQEATNEAPSSVGDGELESQNVRTSSELQSARRQSAVDAFAAIKGKEFVKRTRTLFWTPDKSIRICCAVSKCYEGDYPPYWYSFYPNWDSFLSESEDSFFLLCCMDVNEAFAIPYSWLSANKMNLSQTNKGEKTYWHVALVRTEGGELALNLPKIGMKAPLGPYRFQIP